MRTCGHCGTKVPENYTVCTGCHAVYKMNEVFGIPVLVCVILAFFLCVLAVTCMFGGGFKYGVVLMILSVIVYRLGQRYGNWLSKNATRFSGWYR